MKKTKTVKPKLSESVVQKQIKQYLELVGYTVYRINNTGTWNESQQAHIFHGSKGVPDLLGMKKGHPLLWIEFKGTGGKLSQAQMEFIGLADGLPSVRAICADKLETVIEFLDNPFSFRKAREVARESKQSIATKNNLQKNKNNT